MKTFLTAAVVAASLVMGTPAYAQEKQIAKIEMQVKGPSFWQKVARVITLGMVQTGTDSIKANQPFAIVADHDGIDTDGYRLTMNGVLVTTIPVSGLVNGSISYTFSSGLPKGSYTFIYTAYGEGGETPSDPLGLFSKGAPNKATNLRIVK